MKQGPAPRGETAAPPLSALPPAQARLQQLSGELSAAAESAGKELESSFETLAAEMSPAEHTI